MGEALGKVNSQSIRLEPYLSTAELNQVQEGGGVEVVSNEDSLWHLQQIRLFVDLLSKIKGKSNL